MLTRISSLFCRRPKITAEKKPAPPVEYRLHVTFDTYNASTHQNSTELFSTKVDYQGLEIHFHHADKPKRLSHYNSWSQGFQWFKLKNGAIATFGSTSTRYHTSEWYVRVWSREQVESQHDEEKPEAIWPVYTDDRPGFPSTAHLYLEKYLIGYALSGGGNYLWMLDLRNGNFQSQLILNSSMFDIKMIQGTKHFVLNFLGSDCKWNLSEIWSFNEEQNQFYRVRGLNALHCSFAEERQRCVMTGVEGNNKFLSVYHYTVDRDRYEFEIICSLPFGSEYRGWLNSNEFVYSLQTDAESVYLFHMDTQLSFKMKINPRQMREYISGNTVLFDHDEKTNTGKICGIRGLIDHTEVAELGEDGDQYREKICEELQPLAHVPGVRALVCDYLVTKHSVFLPPEKPLLIQQDPAVRNGL
jgi:hypothetical protein